MPDALDSPRGLLVDALERIEEAARTSEVTTVEALDQLGGIAGGLPSCDELSATSLVSEASRLAKVAGDAMVLLQSQDIVNQQLTWATELIRRALTALGHPEPGSGTTSVLETVDPKATVHERLERQSVADDVFGSSPPASDE